MSCPARRAQVTAVLCPELDLRFAGSRLGMDGHGNAMSRHFSLMHVFVIALALALGGGPRVHAMGGEADLTALVICSEAGVRTIYLDTSGTPAHPVKNCNKCPCCDALLSSMPAISGFALSAPLARRRGGSRHSSPTPRPRRHQRPQSRGPPPGAPGRIDLAYAAKIRVHASAARIDFVQVGSPDLGSCQRYGRQLRDARR